jgi:hypothetical protein
MHSPNMAAVDGDERAVAAPPLAAMTAAVMAAIAQATGTRATAFTLAYLATRVAAMRGWARTGQALLGWPAAQLSVKRTPENSTPTSFRQWCEEMLKPAVVA